MNIVDQFATFSSFFFFSTFVYLALVGTRSYPTNAYVCMIYHQSKFLAIHLINSPSIAVCEKQ